MSQLQHTLESALGQAPTFTKYEMALQLAGLGIAISDLPNRTKVPPAGSHGVKDASADLARANRTWRQHSDRNIAVALGASGLVVIECDKRKGGPLSTAPERLGLTPDDLDTWITQSGSDDDSGHVWYKAPPGNWTTNGNIVKGVDLRAGEAYVVAPPSVHPTGRRYMFRHGGPGSGVEIKPLPAILAQFLTPADEHQTTGRTTTTTGEPTNYGRQMAALLAGLGIAAPAGDTLIRCPFHHPDEVPSWHVDPVRGLHYCFAPGCPANPGGGYLHLRRLSIETFGYDPEAQHYRETVAETTPEPAPYRDGADVPEVARKPLRTIPIPNPAPTCPHGLCGSYVMTTGMGKTTFIAAFCHKRDCDCWQHERARRDLEELTSWPELWLANVPECQYRKTREHIVAVGLRYCAIPRPGGRVLIAIDGILSGVGAFSTPDAMALLYVAHREQPADTRIRRERQPKREAEPVKSKPAPADWTATPSTTYERPDDRRERLNELGDYGARTEAGAMTALCAQLTASRLKDHDIEELLGLWRSTGATVEKHTVRWTVDQGRIMAGLLRDWKSARRRNASVIASKGGSSDATTDGTQPTKSGDGPLPTPEEALDQHLKRLQVRQ